MNKCKYFLLTAGIVLAMVFTLSCSSGGGGDDNQNVSSSSGNGNSSGSGNGNLTSLIKGKFNKNATEQVFFQLNKKTNAVANKMVLARTLSSDESEIEGELKDGNTIIKLRGSYDERSGRYIVSADESSMRFGISDNSFDTTATMIVKDGSDPGNWPVQVFDITEDNTIDITGTAQESATGGLPEDVRGNWYGDATIIFTQWALLFKPVDRDSMVTMPILDIDNKGNYLDIIVGNPQYEATDEQATDAHIALLASRGIEATKFFQQDIDGILIDGMKVSSYCYRIVGSYRCPPNDDWTDCQEIPSIAKEAEACPKVGVSSYFGPKDLYDEVSEVQRALDEGGMEQYLKSIYVQPIAYFHKYKVTYTESNMSWEFYMAPADGWYTGMSRSFAAMKATTTLQKDVYEFGGAILFNR